MAKHARPAKKNDVGRQKKVLETNKLSVTVKWGSL